MKTTISDTVRVRFAPSPTGYVHIGNFRTALFNYLFARHHQGSFLLRIEDTDQERSKPEYTQAILDILEWSGLTYDEERVVQMDRLDEHKKLLDQLLATGKVYRCFCSNEQIEQRIQKKLGVDDAFAHYDTFCRNNPEHEKAELLKNSSYVIRFALPEDQSSLTFHDLVRGDLTYDLAQFDDFIIARSDGTPMYNFVVVADDIFMKITHIIRGEDHIVNTYKQILLYQALNAPLPQFAHLSLILGPSGDRLSKRDAATSVLDYKKMGYLPDALINYLARLGWSHGDQELFTRQELINFFDLDAIGKKGSIFDQVKLDWVNSMYIRACSEQVLLEIIERDVMPNFRQCVSDWDTGTLLALILLYKDRVVTLQELANYLVSLYAGPHEIRQEDKDTWLTPDALKYLQMTLEKFENTDDFSIDFCKNSIKELTKLLAIKLPVIAQPLRLALTGTIASPGVFDLLSILGKDESIKRIRTLLEQVK